MYQAVQQSSLESMNAVRKDFLNVTSIITSVYTTKWLELAGRWYRANNASIYLQRFHILNHDILASHTYTHIQLSVLSLRCLTRRTQFQDTVIEVVLLQWSGIHVVHSRSVKSQRKILIH